MTRSVCAAMLLGFAANLAAAEPVDLSESTLKPGKAVLTLAVNWGRTWKCGTYQNAQIEALTFRRAPLTPESPALELITPSKLNVDNKFVTYALVIEPGEYILMSFDVKVARSTTDVGHLKAAEATLIKDGKPTGGRFTANPDEVVYVGHFGLDCGAEPFLWRYYLQDRKEFEGWVSEFRAQFPFAKTLPAQFRLFETTTLGNPFTLPENK